MMERRTLSGVVMRRMLLITNNRLFFGLCRPGLSVVAALEGCNDASTPLTSLDVVRIARDTIHRGWVLAHHPLYGNVRPRLQPFRTILLLEPERFVDGRPEPDLLSLHLISEAMTVYESERESLALVDAVPESLARDCAFLDAELMKETLAQAGVPATWSSDRTITCCRGQREGERL